MKYLMLWLEAPLQSWGADSKFDLRNTLEFPTKSGIFGLLLSSSGDSGAQRELLSQMSNCPLTVITFKHLHYPDKPQKHDFHMVGNGYNDKDKWEQLHTPKTSDGKKAVGGGAKLTHRYYLQDRKFGVILKFPDDLADKFAQSLSFPVYPLYLGRKCCVPTDIIFRGLFDSEASALAEVTKIGESKSLIPCRKIIEVPLGSVDGITLYDVPLQFGMHKVYSDRTVRIEPFTS